MAERAIDPADVGAVLNRPEGDPLPGKSPGSIELVGAIRGRRLKVIVSAVDPSFVISAYWV